MGYQLKHMVLQMFVGVYSVDKWKPSPSVGLLALGDCHRQTGIWRPGYRAVRKLSMRLLRLDITLALPGRVWLYAFYSGSLSLLASVIKELACRRKLQVNIISPKRVSKVSWRRATPWQ